MQENQQEKKATDNHCWFTPAVKPPSSLWLAYFRHITANTDYTLRAAHTCTPSNKGCTATYHAFMKSSWFEMLSYLCEHLVVINILSRGFGSAEQYESTAEHKKLFASAFGGNTNTVWAMHCEVYTVSWESQDLSGFGSACTKSVLTLVWLVTCCNVTRHINRWCQQKLLLLFFCRIFPVSQLFERDMITSLVDIIDQIFLKLSTSMLLIHKVHQICICVFHFLWQIVKDKLWVWLKTWLILGNSQANIYKCHSIHYYSKYVLT